MQPRGLVQLFRTLLIDKMRHASSRSLAATVLCSARPGNPSLNLAPKGRRALTRTLGRSHPDLGLALFAKTSSGDTTGFLFTEPGRQHF